MASVSKSANGLRTVQFIQSDRKRQSIRLGRVSAKVADAIRSKVEALDAANRLGQTPDPSVTEWVASIDDRMHGRLAKVGLVKPRAQRAKQGLAAFLAEYVKSRVDVKPATLEVWSQVTRNLRAHFGDDRDIGSIHSGDADGFKLWLMGQGLSSTTVSKRVQFARMFFRAAHRRKLCTENPFEDVKSKAISRPERQVFVSRETIGAVLESCDPDWRLIVKLSRFAGFRCPSETFSLQWADINWQAGRMTVQSPKTAHHEGRSSRVVPIFEDIRDELQAAYDRAPEGAVYVLESFRSRAMQKGHWRNANLRTQFERIIRRAGVTPWPRLFHQLRASCETELVRTYPLHVVARWLGHTPAIAVSNYLQVTSEDFANAAAGVSPAAMHTTQKAVQITAAQSGQPRPDVTADFSKPLESSQNQLLNTCSSGENGIRTRGTRDTRYTGLANRRFRPLSHLSGLGFCLVFCVFGCRCPDV